MLSTSKKISISLLLLFFLQIPSLMAIFKYIHVDMAWFVPLYMTVVGIFYYVFFQKVSEPSCLKKLLGTNHTMIFLSACFFLIDIVLYHHELSLQAIGRGTDSGPALILSGVRLLHGLFPYSKLDYLHNPISPGPGWVILTMPFTCTGLYELIIPLLVIVSAFTVKKITQSTLNANIYLLCLLSSPAFVQAMVTGNDYVTMGLAYCLFTVALFYFWQKNKLCKLCFIIGVGMLATARFNFSYLAPLLGFFIWSNNKKEGLYFALGGLFVTFALHAGFYLWDPNHYTPLHVIKDKGARVFSGFHAVVLLSTSIAAVVITLLTLKNTLKSWLFLLWLCLTTPLLILDFFSLRCSHQAIAGYDVFFIMITAPILIMWVALDFRTYSSSQLNKQLI